MADLYTLAYTSETTRDLSPNEIDAILMDARLFNASVGVTGALFYGSDKFFQLLEGKEGDIRKVMERVTRASSHSAIRVLSEGELAHRAFESWHMGFINLPESATQQLSQSAWEDSIPYTREDVEKSEGMGLLMYFWSRWAADSQPSAH